LALKLKGAATLNKKHLSVLVCALLGGSSIAKGQAFSFGIIGGAGLTDDFQSSIIPAQGYSPYMHFYSTSKSYAVGASFAATFPLHFSLEVNGLYRPLHYAFTGSYTNPSGVGDFTHPPATVLTWEFPLLAKYRFPLPVAQPFIEAGPSFRAHGNLNGTSPSNRGATIGAGVEFHFRKVKIAPQFRFTRWADDHIATPWALTKPNQSEVLVGVSF
jgi:hypothetical protein